MAVNPDVPEPRIPRHISAIPDAKRPGTRRHGAERTSYLCEGCGETYHAFRCRDIPARGRFSWARREMEAWVAGRPDPSPWFWTRRGVLWYLRVRKLEAFIAEHQWCEES